MLWRNSDVKPRISTFPKLVREWNTARNGDLRPSDFTAGSAERVWWRCSKDPRHEWDAQINQRTTGSKCPYCAGRRGTAEDNLAIAAPEIALEWHLTKNGKLKATDVRPTAHKSVWWKCPKGRDHEWATMVLTRGKVGVGCPFCAGRRLSETNALSKVAPEIAKQWDARKNGRLSPATQIATAWQLRWWKCPGGPDHEWQDHVWARVVRHAGCPFCKGKRVSVTNELSRVAPDVAKLWHPRKNGDATPKDVTPRSSKSVWWKCPKGPDHEWQAPVRYWSRGVGCPFCANKRVSVTNSLATHHPDIAANWHPSKNGRLTPNDVTRGSGKTAWWQCERGHAWRTRIGHRTYTGSGCPICELMTRRGRPPAMRRRIARVIRLPGDG